MEIYIAEVEGLREEKVFCAMLEKVTEERRRSMEKCRRQEDKIRGLGAGLLLEYGLNRLGLSLLAGNGYEQVFLEYGENGKPYLRDREDICFNLSHSGDYVAAVFASSAVGVDIEEIRQKGEKVARRFFREEEQRYLAEGRWENCREQKFTELWTRKESYIKAVGGGMKIPLHSFSVLGDRVISDFGDERQKKSSWESGSEREKARADGEFFLRTYVMPEGYCLSVCGKVPVEAEPEMVSLVSLLCCDENHFGNDVHLGRDIV